MNAEDAKLISFSALNNKEVSWLYLQNAGSSSAEMKLIQALVCERKLY